MKSKQDKLKKRGYIDAGLAAEHKSTTFDEKTKLLKSKVATNRTLAARLLKENRTIKTVDHLIEALKIEKKLYCKIEICNTLSELKELATSPLILCLGKIGNNQHKTVPEKE